MRKRQFTALLLTILCILPCLCPAVFATPTTSGDLGVVDVEVDRAGNVHVGPNGSYYSGGGTLGKAVKQVIGKYKEIIIVITGLCVITSLIMLLFSIAKLGASGDNQIARSGAIKAIIASGAALAIFGGATIVIGAFWGALG